MSNKNPSNAGKRIPQSIKDGMTIMPPPVSTLDGDLLPYPAEYAQHYADLAAIKRQHPIYIEEHVEDENAKGFASHLCYQMTIRCMSSAEDLRVILDAAAHLGLISTYRIERGEVDTLDPELEMNYIVVHSSIGSVDMNITEGAPVVNVPIYVQDRKRKEIWIGLFDAAGYRVEWGNALNIRKRKL